MKIKECRTISMTKLRQYCINNNYYDEGTNEEYDKMLKNAQIHCTPERLYDIACDICKHSSELKEARGFIQAVMFDLVELSYSTFYIFEDED